MTRDLLSDVNVNAYNGAFGALIEGNGRRDVLSDAKSLT